MALLVDELLELLGRDDLLQGEKSTELAVDPIALCSVTVHADATPDNITAVPGIGLIDTNADGGLSINHEQQHDQAA